MIAISLLVMAAVAAVSMLFLLSVRTWAVHESANEARLRGGAVHTVAYTVPDGQDPVVLMVALSRAGFLSAVTTNGGTERLLVACDEEDRSTVRHVIHEVDRAGLDGPESHVDHVDFDDEPVAAPSLLSVEPFDRRSAGS